MDVFDEIAEMAKREARRMIERNKEMERLEKIRKRQEQIDALFKQSGLGKRFTKRTFDTFIINDKNKRAFEEAQKFVKNFPDTLGLMFVGSVGVGKTHLAAAIANELIKNLHTVIFGNSTDIILRFKKTFGTNESELDVIEALTNVDLLVIDDLGKERATEYTGTLIYQIINRLYEDDKPLIITTNFSSKQLEERLGDKGAATLSRLYEMCKPIIINDKDWRVKKNGK